MILNDDWIRMKMWQMPRESTVILPKSLTEERDPTAEDVFFEVIESGPMVTKVAVGDVIMASPLQGVMRFKLPNESFKSYALREGELIGTLTQQERTA